MKSEKKQRNVTSFLFVVWVVCLDWFFQNKLKGMGYGIENSGVSFGIGGEHGMLISVGVLIALLALGTWLCITKSKKNDYLLILLIGGVGNLVPRLFWGHVWDYMRIPIVNLWFNLSDILISVGALSYILVGDD